MKKTVLITCTILFACLISSKAQLGYRIANKIHVEGDEGWDLMAMDDISARLFVSHGNMVQVVDVKSAKLLGTIPDTKGVHGIALAIDLNKGYISNGKDSSVTVFNLSTLAVLTKVQVTGRNPDAILYDEFSHKVFVFNGGSSNVTVMDAALDKVIATISLDGKPELSVADGKGNVYVNIEDKSKVCVINSTTLKVEQSWDVSPGKEPSGIALDNDKGRLFSVCDNKLMVVIDVKTGRVITSLPIGERVDGAAFDPIKKRAYSSNGEGTLTVVQEVDSNTFKVIENVTTQKGAKTIALDAKTHHIYLTTAEFGPTPAANKDNPRPRPTIKPGTFVILDVESTK